MRAAFLLVLAAACIDPHYTTCGSVVCVRTQVCSSDDRCVSPDQVVACNALADGARCTFGTADVGFCHRGACLTTLDACGDGVASLSLDELCDCGTPDVLAAPPLGCNGFNSNDPTATCRLDCRPARCGDGIVDANEQCDDGNTIPGDGCRADCAGRFTKQQTPTANILDYVAVLAPDNAYAVGEYGTLLHYNGTDWSSVATPAGLDVNLIGVWARTPNDIYVVGNSTTPLMIHFDGTTWSTIATGAPNTLGNVWGSSATDVYAISARYTNPLDVLHWNGVQWTPVNACPSLHNANAIVGTSATNIYIGALNGLCHYNGVAWTVIDNSIGAHDLTQISSTEVVALTDTVPQYIRRWTGAVGAASIQVPGDAFGLAATSPDEILVVGDAGVLSFANGRWTHLVIPTELGLFHAAATSPNNVFVVGRTGTMLH